MSSGRRQHDVGKEVLLVGEVLVDGLLGDPGAHGDVFHGGAVVPIGQEDPDGRFTDLAVASIRASLRLFGRGRDWHAMRVLDRLVPVQYYTV